MLNKICIEDNIQFKTSVEVLNECFGKNYKGFQKAGCYLGGDMFVWFPKLALKMDGQYKAQSKTKPWINVLSDDGKTLEMIAETDDFDRERILKRSGIIFTFAKCEPKEGYRYIGTFIMAVEECTDLRFIYRRIDTVIDFEELYNYQVPENEEDQERHAKQLSKSQLYRIAKERGSEKPKMSERTVATWGRDKYVKELAKTRADGICELCKEPAPFVASDGKPFLETHHIKWLSRGGSDTIENCVALCPNCHRKMHYCENVEDIKTLMKIAKYITV